MSDQTTPDGFDPKLQALFAQEHTHVPPEPFVGATLRAVAFARRRAVWKTRFVIAAAFLGLVLLSPQLIAGSMWVSSGLDELFALASASPVALVVAGLCALAAFAAKRARLW